MLANNGGHLPAQVSESSGFGIDNLSGNGFNTMGNFFHERAYLNIPLAFTFKYVIIEDILKVSFIQMYFAIIYDVQTSNPKNEAIIINAI